jgi:hypothetical protein
MDEFRRRTQLLRTRVKNRGNLGAHDRDNCVAYLTGEHYRGQAEPIIHARGHQSVARMDTRLDRPRRKRQKPDRRPSAAPNL